MSPRLLLFYAGMADDLETEQIGLAVSDGDAFERVGEGGLVVRRDASRAWRALRVCNPTVVADDTGFVMYYQGVANGLQHTSLAIARSEDGLQWRAEPEPFLGWEAMRSVDPGFDATQRVGLWEPSVIIEPRRVRIWFVYSHVSQPGNSIWYAESVDGEAWTIAGTPVLQGNAFGNFAIHYPQVLHTRNGYELWFTLRNRDNGVDGIFVSRSGDAVRWDAPRQVLPRTRRPFRLERKQVIPALVSTLAGRVSFGRRVVAKVELEASRRLRTAQANALGFSHSHVVEAGDETLIVLHNDHLGARGRWMDIALGQLKNGGVRGLRTVLSPGPSGAWDGYFVADPFLVVVPGRS